MDRDPAAQLAGLADHALPRQPITGLGDLHGRAGDAAAAGDAGELGDLAVGRDASARNLAHHGVDPPVQLAHVREIIRFAGLSS